MTENIKNEIIILYDENNSGFIIDADSMSLQSITKKN